MSVALLIYIYIFSASLILSGFSKVVLRYLGKYEKVPRTVYIEELATVVFSAVCCVAMFGYVYEVPIIGALFWKVVSVFAIVHLVASFWLPKQILLRKELTLGRYITFNVIGYLIGLPFYLMLFSYSFISFPSGAV